MATMAVEVRGGGHAGGSTCRPRSLSPAALLPPPAPARLLLRCSARGCDKAFTKPSKLLQHERTHTGERPFACQHDGCGASFGRKDHLDRHAQTHLDEDDDNDDDGRGAATMRRRPFRCEYKAGSVECGKRFLTAQHLRRHKDETHDDARAVGMSTTDDEDDEREEVAVAESGRGDDASSSVMGQHGVPGKKKRGGKRSRAGGEGAYQCDVPDCELSFTKRKHLRTHIAVSHAVRVPVPVPVAAQGDGEDITSPLFPCSHPGCLKQFPTHSKRAAHLRTAHDAHRYMCTLPHESGDVLFFSTWSDLQRHQRDVHPPRCHWPGCKDKVFKTRENLKAHLRRHMEKDRHLQDQGLVLPPSSSTTSGPTGRVAQTSMTFECPNCDKAFASKYARDVHAKTVHLGQRDYACKNAGCDKRYGHKHLVVRHARVCPFRLIQGDSRADGKGEGEHDEDEADDEEEAPGGDEEDMDDDFFRREGGAVPEESASRGRVRKRKLDADEGAPKSFLVDLLTGRGYGAKAAPKKRRLAKGRILACPWSKISAELAKRGGESSNSSSSAGITCDYRFSRVYDVQRHLASKHQVDLSQLEIRALLTSEERQALPNPRPSVPQRDQTLYTYDDSDISDRESN